MNLLKFEDYKVIISPEALALVPFRKIWNRDRSQSKDRAISEIAYIYFMVDPRSDYQYLIDQDDRHKAIVEGEGFPEGWKPDKLIQEAMELYEGFKTSAALVLEDTRTAVDNLRKFLREIDLNKEDDKGRLVYTISSVTSALKQIPGLIKDLIEAEKAVNKEMAEHGGKVRGQKAKKIMEDGIQL